MKLSFGDALFFENTIIHLRSFIDLAQKLSCLILGYSDQIKGTKDFKKILSRIDSNKARLIEEKFIEIMDEDSWGYIVKQIRDKIVHFDIIKTRSEYRPQIQGLVYEKFCQKLENGMFELLTDLHLILFEKEWVSGYVSK